VPQRPDYYPLGGGLDEITPSINVNPGRLIACRNHEANAQGYSLCAGYERFDGHPSPSAAAVGTITYTPNTVVLSAGDKITGALSGAVGTLVSAPIVMRDAIAGSPLDLVPLTAVSGTFQIGENLLRGATVVGVDASTFSPVDEHDGAQQLGWVVAAREIARGLISAVPGSGPVRGVYSFNGKRYAWRDNAGATACVMYGESANGWQAVTGTLRRISLTQTTANNPITPGQIVTGQTSGAHATVRRIVTRTTDTPTGKLLTGDLLVSDQTGTFSNETINVGATAVGTVKGPGDAPGFPAGGKYRFVAHNFYAQAGMKMLYGVNGVGRAFAFDGQYVIPIVTGNAVDTPGQVEVYKQQLFLGFPAAHCRTAGSASRYCSMRLSALRRSASGTRSPTSCHPTARSSSTIAARSTRSPARRSTISRSTS
jgi:hypothetical protein